METEGNPCTILSTTIKKLAVSNIGHLQGSITTKGEMVQFTISLIENNE